MLATRNNDECNKISQCTTNSNIPLDFFPPHIYLPVVQLPIVTRAHITSPLKNYVTLLKMMGAI